MYLLLQSNPPIGPVDSYRPMDWLVIAMVTLAICYLLLRNTAKRSRRDPLTDSTPRLSLAQQRATERAMESLLVELSEMSRKISGQLDTRAARLEALLREADEKIEQLRAAQAGEPLPSPPPDPIPLHPAAVPLPRPPRRTAGDDRPALRIAQPEPAVDPRHAEVYRLADQGLAPGQIAQQLDRPSGEIELILALRST